MCNGDIEGWKFVCVEVEFLVLYVLFHTKNWFFNKKYTIAICVGHVWIAIICCLFENQAFGFINAIGKQIQFYVMLNECFLCFFPFY